MAEIGRLGIELHVKNKLSNKVAPEASEVPEEQDDSYDLKSFEEDKEDGSAEADEICDEVEQPVKDDHLPNDA